MIGDDWTPPQAGGWTDSRRPAFRPRPRRRWSDPEEGRLRGLAEIQKDLKRGRIPEEFLAKTLLRLGREGYVLGWAEVAAHLDHANPEVRRAALQVLVFDWKMDHYRAKCEEFIASDPDSDSRRFAATCLGVLLQSTHDKKALRTLAEVVKREMESPRVRGAAYIAALRVTGRKGKDIPFIGNEDDLKARVDWKLVEACLNDRWEEISFV